MNIKNKLELFYNRFNSVLSENDPVEFPSRYSLPVDIEFAAFVSAVFSFGNITAIKKTLNNLLLQFGNNPVTVLTQSPEHILIKNLEKIKYRFFTSNDIIDLFLILKSIYSNNLNLKNIFLKGFSLNDKNVKNGIESLHLHFITSINSNSHGIKFMFPLPSNNSCCKRANLFLRWMVRNDNIDFGIWNEIPASKLIIPVDTHIAKISKQLKLTTLKNPSWKMAEEITSNLAKYSPDDPVKYDFALCHLGVNKTPFD